MWCRLQTRGWRTNIGQKPAQDAMSPWQIPSQFSLFTDWFLLMEDWQADFLDVVFLAACVFVELGPKLKIRSKKSDKFLRGSEWDSLMLAILGVFVWIWQRKNCPTSPTHDTSCAEEKPEKILRLTQSLGYVWLFILSWVQINAWSSLVQSSDHSHINTATQ